MKKGTVLGLALTLAAGAAAVLLLGRHGEAEEPARETAAEKGPAPVDANKTVAFPLKDKYADYSRGQDDPIYRFALDTPSGAKEITVNQTQYETYYIGDEVLCLETGHGLEIV